MKVVIQCAAGKQPDAGSLHAPDGQKVVFVAPPEHAPPTDAGADNRLERGGRGDYAASHARCRHLRPREHEGADGEPEPADPVPGLRGLLPARRARRPGAVQGRGRERKDRGSDGTAEAAHVLPHQQGSRPLRRRVQPDALRARQVRPLCIALAAAVTGHLAAVGHRADRRHVNRQADGRRAGRVRAVRQRRALGSNTRRHEGRARDRTPGVPRAHRLRQRGALGGPELAARPGARRTFARRSRTTRRAASTSSRCSNA